MIDERNPLTFHLVPAAFLIGNKLEDDVGGRPIGAQQREVPLEHRAVARFGPPVAHGDERNLVGRCPLREREGHAGRERQDVGRAGRALVLEALVALHAAVGGIAELALLPHQLDTVDAAVALVDEGVVVSKDELLVLRQRRRSRRHATQDSRDRDPCMLSSHCLASHRHSSTLTHRTWPMRAGHSGGSTRLWASIRTPTANLQH